MKGIILAGGSGTRLHPMTIAISKQLLPIYDKPMIYYPLSVLMLAGIKEIMIISNPEFIDFYEKLFGNGEKFGIKIVYKIQEAPRGLAEALILSEEFAENEKVCLILGDNIFYGQGFSGILKKAASFDEGAVIFAYYVKNPEEFGVVEFDDDGMVLSIEEKPKHPKSNFAIPGLYFYDNKAASLAKAQKPSPRGELEITDLNLTYQKMGQLRVEKFGRGFAWLDTGTSDGLLEASNFVRTVQKRQGLYIACLEEIAYKMGFINKEQLRVLAQSQLKTEYGQYMNDLVELH